MALEIDQHELGETLRDLLASTVLFGPTAKTFKVNAKGQFNRAQLQDFIGYSDYRKWWLQLSNFRSEFVYDLCQQLGFKELPTFNNDDERRQFFLARHHGRLKFDEDEREKRKECVAALNMFTTKSGDWLGFAGDWVIPQLVFDSLISTNDLFRSVVSSQVLCGQHARDDDDNNNKNNIDEAKDEDEPPTKKAKPTTVDDNNHNNTDDDNDRKMAFMTEAYEALVDKERFARAALEGQVKEMKTTLDTLSSDNSKLATQLAKIIQDGLAREIALTQYKQQIVQLTKTNSELTTKMEDCRKLRMISSDVVRQMVVASHTMVNTWDAAAKEMGLNAQSH